MKNEVVITDINYRMSIPAIWSLKSIGVKITVVSYSNIKKIHRLGFFSNKISYKKTIKSPDENEREFLIGMEDISNEVQARSGKLPVLIVVGSLSMQYITKNLEFFERLFLLNVVDENTYYIANNTYSLGKCAINNNVDFPNTHILYDENKEQNQDIDNLADKFKFPVVIKYQLGEKLSIGARDRYCIVNNKEEFKLNYLRMNNIQSNPLAQEYVAGSGFGVSVVLDEDSIPLEIYCHRRIRELPITGGPSTFCEPIWNDRMVSDALKLLKALNWRGYAMVEFKGKVDKDIKLMEINPRFWGSMIASYNSGINMASSYYYSLVGLEHMVKNRNIEVHNNRYELGMRSYRTQFFLQDLISAFKYSFKNKNMKYIKSFIVSTLNPHVKGGLFALHDMKPFFVYMLGLVAR